MLYEHDISTHSNADLWREWKSSSPNRRASKWLVEFITWDGLLPLAVAACPWAVRILLPQNDIAEVSAVIFIPMAAALLRTLTGAQQIRRACGGALPAVRQVALATAIVLLLFFESGVGLLTVGKDEPVSAWKYVFCFYACYLVAAAFAFFPRQARNCKRAGE
jgi:hypothetical protein